MKRNSQRKMQRNFKLRTNFNSSMPNVMVIIRWTLIVIVMVLTQIKITDAAKYNGEGCTTKGQPGICREWSECPILKTLIESGQYSNKEVVNCGFGIREELICCPTVNINTNTNNTPGTNTNSGDFKVAIPTTAPVYARDFGLDSIKNTTTATIIPNISETTQKPDFWLHLLTTTTTARPSTTTTIKPLMLGNQRLNESSEFFDFNDLLSRKHSGGRKSERQVTTTVPSTPLNGNANAYDRGNLNSVGKNLNQWIFEEPGSNNNNNFRGNGNSGRGQNNGRGQGNGWGRGRPGLGNQNRGFTFPGGNARQNQFFKEDILPIYKPGGPANTFMEQNPSLQDFNLNPTFNLDSNINQSNNDKHNEQQHLEKLIKDVFDTSIQSSKKVKVSDSTLENPIEGNLEKSTAAVFNQSPQIQNSKIEQEKYQNNKQHAISTNLNPATVWLSPQDTATLAGENAQIIIDQPQQQVAFQNPHITGQVEIIPVAEQQMKGNNLEEAPSTNFIQQPVIVATWPNTPSVPQPQVFNPVQVVYDNLLNSGIDIVKSNDMQPQEQQFLPQPQVVVFQSPPLQNNPHFVQQPQQPQVFFQQPLAQYPSFIQQQSQQLIDQQQQSESLMKEPRSTSTTQQKFVQQPNHSNALMPNIQSPPAKVLDRYKPFEFRPPPANEITFSEDNNSLSPNTTPSQWSSNGERPAARACRRIERGLRGTLSQHILGGTPAELGEFPHMVALGYTPIGGSNRAQYDIRCGGTLIDKRFVLTAAHCVSDRENVPSIVRLGVVDFKDEEQMKQAVELKIKETFIHDNYTSRLSYNDIAILELEREVETTEYIYPVCLYMNEADPDPKIKLWVTGWGTVNTTTRSYSNVLLKAPLHTTPLENCNSRIVEYGLTRKIPEGIIRSQFCAEDEHQIKDACQGDSGGPLNLVVDETLKNYRLVGVVSTGFGCASSTPGLYTRVATYLDFIERIVWPNGGD